MEDISLFFKNKKVIFDRLLPFGFSGHEGTYIFTASLVKGQFAMIVKITASGEISTEVIDSVSKENYVLHQIAQAQGKFVGKVRAEYEEILAGISDACFENDVFHSEQARQIIAYIKDKYHNEPEFLWERFSNNAVFRRQDNQKWYAALLTVQRQKLGLSGIGQIEIIDLKAKPEQLDALIDGQKYLPGYHMNKKHWLTICLDDSISIEEIFCRIDKSFALAEK